jgi:hypothetical protein
MGVLPMKCRRYLTERDIAFEEVEEGGQKAVVLRNMPLPPGRFAVSLADFLILLPAGYPDNPPDMFHARPWLTLVPTNRYPRAADQTVVFNGTNWQRWSRHNNAWRPGIDGIWTMIKRVETALKEAA